MFAPFLFALHAVRLSARCFSLLLLHDLSSFPVFPSFPFSFPPPSPPSLSLSSPSLPLIPALML